MILTPVGGTPGCEPVKRPLISHPQGNLGATDVVKSPTLGVRSLESTVCIRCNNKIYANLTLIYATTLSSENLCLGED